MARAFEAREVFATGPDAEGWARRRLRGALDLGAGTFVLEHEASSAWAPSRDPSGGRDETRVRGRFQVSGEELSLEIQRGTRTHGSWNLPGERTSAWVGTTRRLRVEDSAALARAGALETSLGELPAGTTLRGGDRVEAPRE